MPQTSKSWSLSAQTANCASFEETLSTATGSTQPVFLTGQVSVQITGAATDIEALVERSTRDPAGPGGANWAPADEVAITGNPSTGIAVESFDEPAAAWWRVRLLSMAGASATIVISGPTA